MSCVPLLKSSPDETGEHLPAISEVQLPVLAQGRAVFAYPDPARAACELLRWARLDPEVGSTIHGGGEVRRGD